MSDWFSSNVGRWLRLPGEPDPPRGRAGSVRVFRAAPGFLRYRRAGWALRQLSAIIGLAFGFLFLRLAGTGIKLVDKLGEQLLHWDGFALIQAFELLAVAAFLIQLVPSWMLLELDYKCRWYMTTDRSLRIREGLWRTEERTMTFSNLQNVEVRQGPLQRLFGIADLQVQTAGGGGSEESKSSGHSAKDPLHVGRFQGIDNAPEIRDAILAKLRELEDSGLGNPEDRSSNQGQAQTATRPSSATLEAAQDVLLQVRSLSNTLRT